VQMKAPKPYKTWAAWRDAVRQAFADYHASEGCTCCQDIEGHEKAAKRLAELLDVPMFDDGSGYDFWKFTTDRR